MIQKVFKNRFLKIIISNTVDWYEICICIKNGYKEFVLSYCLFSSISLHVHQPWLKIESFYPFNGYVLALKNLMDLVDLNDLQNCFKLLDIKNFLHDYILWLCICSVLFSLMGSPSCIKLDGISNFGKLRVINYNQKRYYSNSVEKSGLNSGYSESILKDLEETRKEFDVSTLPVQRLLKLDELIQRFSDCEDGLDGMDLYKEIYSEIEKILQVFKNINSKGYINDMDISNYELISECVKDFLLIKDENVEKDKKVKKEPIKGKELKIDGKIVTYAEVEELFKWSYNLINLNLYRYTEVLILKLHEFVKKDNLIDEDDDCNFRDLLTDSLTLSKEIYHKLDPSIRLQISKKGILITQNIYSGFDTEYQKIDLAKNLNKLLSIQLSVNTKTMVRFPCKNKFDFRSIDVLTGNELGSRINNKNITESIAWWKIKSFINNTVDDIRVCKYGNFDKSIGKLVEGLKNYEIDGSKRIRYIDNGDTITFIFDRTEIKQYFNECNEFSFEELVKVSYQLVENDLEESSLYIKNTLENISKNSINMDISVNNADTSVNIDEGEVELADIKTNLEKMVETIEEIKPGDKELAKGFFRDSKNKYTRTNNTSYTDERVSVTKKLNNYIISHYTPADLSMLSDFDNKYKYELDLVNKCFVTLGKPILIGGMNVIVRDTMLIAPGKKSLNAISTLYEGINKVKMSEEQMNNLEQVQVDDPELFKKYAMQDSLIVLIHGCYMEDFNHSIKGFGIPLTLSGLSSNYIRKYWKEIDYNGYQLSGRYLLTNVGRSLTPKGLSVLKDVGVKSTMFIANYRGGRNESFMYGYDMDKSKIWFDYDLISAYTTSMLILGAPNYSLAKSISYAQYSKIRWEDRFNSYTVLNVNFEFPESVKYPSIPCNVDENTTVYPLKGSSIITAMEEMVARRQGATIKIKDIYHIPFKKKAALDGTIVIEKPFHDCIRKIQGERSKYPKGTIGNVLWKEIGNSIYGLVVRGINEKMKFDARTKQMKRMEGNDLSNPIIASWITSFIRSVISELLHTIQLLGGEIVSVTTDGFITNIEDLEKKVLEHKFMNRSFYQEYRKIHNNKDILELKNHGWGIMSWSTRGQLSVAGKIIAASGFQRGSLPLEEINRIIMDKMLSDKELTFIQKQLRSGKDIFNHGGQVTDVYSDKIFRIMFDNKRMIQDIGVDNKTLYDSKPLITVDEGSLLRSIGKLPKTSLYAKNLSNNTSGKYKNKRDIMVRNFVRALLNNMFNLRIDEFKSYKEIVNFLKDYDDDIYLTENIISQLKRRGNFCKVPKTVDWLIFVNHVKSKFPGFAEDEFFIS